jgi:hypothetical protein
MQQFLAKVSNGSSVHKYGSSLDVVVNAKQGGESVTILEVTCRTVDNKLIVTVWDSIGHKTIGQVELQKD